ncbi:MAG: hypothetical protein ABID87_08485 [Chloroflexota bacterium]
MYHTIAIEDLGKPAVALCHTGFVIDAKSAAAAEGMPGIRLVLEAVPPECSVPEQVEAGVMAAMDDIVTALTIPLTAEEASPKLKKAEKVPRIAFKGSLEEVNRFFYRRGWGDGLPVVPPTKEAVAEMLAGTDLPPDHVVGKVIPRFGKATVEKIAINAVMAGALPTVMPLLMAGIQALADPATRFLASQSSTGSFGPFWIINGPVRRDLNIDSGAEALTPGDIGSSTFGRAMGLIIKNIGGARKGVEDKGTLGNPAKYSTVLAENEEESPWEPLQVTQGFEKEDSTLTVFFPNAGVQLLTYGTDVRGILNAIIYNVVPGKKGLCCLVLPPPHARTLHQEGWTKKQVRAFISEFARVPAYRHTLYWGGEPEVLAKERMPFGPEDSMRILRHADWIRVVVAGGPSNFIGLFTGGGSKFPGEGTGGVDFVTRKVELPSGWAKLVKKYKDVVPAYQRY